MHKEEIGRLTPGKAEKISKALDAVEYALPDIISDLEDEGLEEDPEKIKEDTGTIGQYLSANRDEYEIEEEPKTSHLNMALGFMDFHGVIEMDGEVIHEKSQSEHNEFYPFTYDENRMENLIDSLDKEISTKERDRYGNHRGQEHDFSGIR